MSITDILKGFKDKALDAATYELLQRNFVLLEDNNQQLKDQVTFLKEDNGKLKAENQRLSEENARISGELGNIKTDDEFVLEDGIAFKKNESGGVDPHPYCPKCHGLLSQFANWDYSCDPCKYSTTTYTAMKTLAENISKGLQAK